MIKGLKQWEYWYELRKKSGGLKRNATPIKRTGIKKKWYPKKKKIKGLFEWYVERAEECRWICEECGENVFSTDENFQLACLAHLLCKKLFPSVALHPQNCKCLGGVCGCHRKYDKNWSSAQGMKVWPDAERIILTVLIPLLPPDEYSKLPDFLKVNYESSKQ